MKRTDRSAPLPHPCPSNGPRLQLVTGHGSEAPADEASSAAQLDAALVARCLQGERAAATRLYRRHARRIAGIVHRLVGPDAVEDLVQEAFAEAFGSLSRLREPERFGAWLSTITIRKARRAVRRLLRDPRRQEALLESLVDARAPVPDDVVDAYRRLTQLPSRVYVVWMLRRVEGYTVARIAQICRIGTSTVKRMVARGDAVLERFIEIEQEEHP